MDRISVSVLPEFNVYDPATRLLTACIKVSTSALPANAVPRQVGLVVVADTSSSMREPLTARKDSITKHGATKLTIAALFKEAARQRNVDMNVSLLSYNTDVETCLEAVSLSADGALDQVLATVNTLSNPAGCTDIAKALAAAKEQVLALIAKGIRDNHVFIFTDGEADANEANSLSQLSKSAAEFPEFHAALHAMALGHNADEAVMKALAEQGRGNYFASDKLVDMADAFGICLGASLETVAKGVVVYANPVDDCVMVFTQLPMLRDPAVLAEAFEPFGMVRALGNLMASEERHILVEARLLRDPEGQTEVPFLDVELSYLPRDAHLDEERKKVTCRASVSIGAVVQSDARVSHPDVILARQRVEVGGVIQEAVDMAAAKGLEPARAHIRALLERLGNDATVQTMRDQLQLVLNKDLASAEHFAKEGSRTASLRSGEQQSGMFNPLLGTESGMLSTGLRGATESVRSQLFEAMQVDADSDDADDDGNLDAPPPLKRLRTSSAPQDQPSGTGLTGPINMLNIGGGLDARENQASAGFMSGPLGF
jgi:hypothetical protein